MKRIIYVLIMLLSLVACETDNSMFYKGEAGLYFVDGGDVDSVVYSFTTTTESFIEVRLPVETLGRPVDIDRNFTVQIDETESTALEGEDYEGLQNFYVMPANSCSSEVVFQLLYTSKLDNGPVRITLELESSDIFPDILPEKRRMQVIWSNELIVPVPMEDWDWFYGRYFGPYSKVKHRYILSVLGLTELPDKFDARMYYMGLKVNNYFADHEIYDENGNLIETWIIGE